MWRPIWKFRTVNNGVNFCCWKSTAGVSKECSARPLTTQGACSSGDGGCPQAGRCQPKVGWLVTGTFAREIVLEPLARPGSSPGESQDHPQSLVPWLCLTGANAPRLQGPWLAAGLWVKPRLGRGLVVDFRVPEASLEPQWPDVAGSAARGAVGLGELCARCG